MQTFLPYDSFEMSAAALDRQRLGKQRVEVMQILTILRNKAGSWFRHPAVKMWEGHEVALGEYGIAICREWTQRGYRDSCEGKIRTRMTWFNNSEVPWWFGDECLHSSHRARLLAKNPAFYKHFGWKEQPSEEYWWPNKNKES